jgi:hypothetical protein
MGFITQILLPKRDNFGTRFGRDHYNAVHQRLIRKFGGWTRKGQVQGAWLSPSGEVSTDEHWLYEVGRPRRDLRFWQAEKARLMTEFDQEDIWINQYEGRRI